MLDQIPARMLSEWIAYERFAGPVGQEWRDEILASTHEAIQVNSGLVGAGIPRKKGKKNPAPKFRRIPRPTEVFNHDEQEDEDDDEEE